MTTPRPWTHDKDGRIRDARGLLIAQVRMNSLFAGGEAEALANGELIAAAPEMRDMIESLVEVWPNGDGILDRAYPSLESAQKLLAKLGGEK